LSFETASILIREDITQVIRLLDKAVALAVVAGTQVAAIFLATRVSKFAQQAALAGELKNTIS